MILPFTLDLRGAWLTLTVLSYTYEKSKGRGCCLTLMLSSLVG
jgi:hypothetical protein